MIISVRSEFLLGLLDEVGSKRALADHETDIIQEIVTANQQPFRWNPRLNNQLEVAASSPGGIRRFARRLGITEGAAYQQHDRIKKRKARKAARRARKA